VSRLTELDIAYIAGVVDVRANIAVKLFGGTELPFVSVSTPDLKLVAFLAHSSDMSPVTVKRDYLRVGCTDHCSEQHLHVKSETARWSVSGAKATIILAAVQPFTRIQVAAVDEALECGLRAPRKASTPAKMSALGWPLPSWEAAA